MQFLNMIFLVVFNYAGQKSNKDAIITHGMLSGAQLLTKKKGKTLRWNREKF